MFRLVDERTLVISRDKAATQLKSVYELILVPIVIWIISGNGMTIYAIMRLMPAKTCHRQQRRKRCTFMYLLSSAVGNRSKLDLTDIWLTTKIYKL